MTMQLKKYFFLLGLPALLVAESCGNKKTNQQQEKTQTETSAKDTIQASEPTTIPAKNIIFEIKDVHSISGRGTAAEGTIIIDSVYTGMPVQIIGIDKPLIDAVISNIEIDRKNLEYGLAGQNADLILGDINRDTLKSYQRIVVAKTKTEKDLKPAKEFADVLGQINNGIYRNESFGFTMNVAQTGFKGQLNPQEGFKVSFQNPASFANADVVTFSNNADNPIQLYVSFSVSSLQAITRKTAKEELEYEYLQYKVTAEQKLLNDKQVSYVRIKHDDGKIMDIYAMLVNGYYITWQLRYDGEKDAAKKEAEALLNSIYFDWAKK